MERHTRAVSVLSFVLVAACATGTPSNDPSDAGDPQLKETAPDEVYCGDGEVAWEEDCDGDTEQLCADVDSAYTSGALGCTGSCRFDYSDCGPVICGNGRLEDGEECDDRRTDDYCPEYGEECTICRSDCTNGPGIPAGCGDGHVFVEYEICDPEAATPCSEFGYDGGVVGCTDDCLDPDFSACEGSVCGNGILDDGEACDDSDANTLVCEYGETACEVCTPDCDLAAGLTSFCDDSLIDDEREDCDPVGSTDPTLCDGYPMSAGTAVCSELCKWDFDLCGPGEVDPDVGADVGIDTDVGLDAEADTNADTGAPLTDAGSDADPTPPSGDSGCSSTRSPGTSLWSALGLLGLSARRRGKALR